MVFQKGHKLMKESIDKIKNSNYHSNLKDKKNQEAICLFCGKKYLRNSDRTPLQIYCSKGCTDKGYKKRHRIELNIKKREHHIKNRVQTYESNFVHYHQDEIGKIIGIKCALCDNESLNHHLSYKDLPHKNIREYCKFLMPLCNSHHQEFHKIMNKYGGIEQ